MKYKILSVLAFVGLLGGGFTATAATYQYVNTSGSLQIVEAPNSETAMAIAQNKAPRSGVMLISSSNIGGVGGTTVITVTPVTPTTPMFTVIGGTGARTYSYVDNSGSVRMVMASDASTALRTAPNIAPHSGVMLVN